MHKIIPLVLVFALSLIIGNQAAFAETDVWAFYGEVGGSDTDATIPGKACGANTCSESSGIAGDGTKFLVGHFEDYQNIASANTAPVANLKGPLIKASCWGNSDNPTDNSGTFSWDFSGATGAASTLNCVQNQRGDADLGLGVDLPEILFAPEDEVEVGEIVVLDLSALLGDYTNFMFRLSSNSAGEEGWAGVSDTPPTGTVTHMDFQGATGSLLGGNGLFPGASAGNNFNDVYTSFTPKNFLYYSQTIENSDNILQQIKATKIPDDMVGGHGGITDNTALLVSGSHLTASWMIPLIVSAIGIGVFVVTRK